MTWTIIRIDFTEKCMCVFGEKKHYITCGKGYVVVNSEGNEAFCGPQCAKNPKYLINPNEIVPVLTKGCLEINVKEQNSSTHITINNNQLPSQINNLELHREKAIAYLLLRVEKLNHYPKIKYNKLDDIYNRYLSNKLTHSDICFLSKLVICADYPEYSYQNLQAIYACDFWIDQFLKQNTNKNLSFMKDIKKHLHKKLALSTKQIKGLNSWFDNTKGNKIVNIKLNAFAINPKTHWLKKSYK